MTTKDYYEEQERLKSSRIKKIVAAVVGVIIAITLLSINPFSINDAGERVVVQRTNGEQLVRFQPGLFYAGFFATETRWPNQISVVYQENEPNLDFNDNGIEIGTISIMFSDRTKANVKGITQFVLPSSESEMILIHNTHRTPESLVAKRLATFTKECLQSSSSLLSSDKHSGGGRAQMSQDFLDQLKNGVFLADIKERNYYDSLDRETKREYVAQIKTDKNGQPLRKLSDIAEYGITVASASIIDTDYEDIVDKRRDKIIEAATATALSRQSLMKAQQEALTKKAEGERELVEIEYSTKKDQTKQVVEAETKVRVAEQDKLQQKIQAEAAELEARKIKTLADADAYKKRTTIQANGALELKLQTWLEGQKYWADAFGKYQGNVSPQIVTGNTGGTNGNAAMNLMDIIAAKSARDLALDLKAKGN